MTKLFHTTASPLVRKCTVTIKQLGFEDHVETVTTKLPHPWGAETVPYRADFLAPTLIISEQGRR